MASLYEDVRFDRRTTAELAAECRSTARLLDDQREHRRRVAGQAQDQWRGRYRDQFDRQLEICYRDSETLADKLREIARRLEEAAVQAHVEQARRERARREEEKSRRRKA